MLKRLWKYCMLLGIITPISLSAQTIGIPYEQDFESFSPCYVDCRFSCTLAEAWYNASDDQTDWSVGTDSTPTPHTGPSKDFSSGAYWGKYLYLEASNGCQNGAEAALISPYFDFNNVEQPMLSFAYHMWGQGQGSISLDVDTSGSWVQHIIPPLRGDENQWKIFTKCFLWLANKQQVRFRIRGITGRTETSDIAIDAFKVYDAYQQDVALLSVSNTFCGLSNQANLKITFENQGRSTLPNLAVSYSINQSGFSQPEIIPAGIAPCATGTYVFRQLINLTTTGPHKITVAFQQLSQDPNPQNDSLSTTFFPTYTVSDFPYKESFEQGPAHWIATGTNSSWQWGIPNRNWINQASHGQYAWHTTNGQGSYNNGEYSYLISPNFDLSDYQTDPIFAFDHSFQLEYMTDSSWMEYSLDGGKNWRKIAQEFASIENGYNNSADQVWTGNSLAGSGQWQTSALRLDGLAGRCVRLRFVLFTDRSIRQEGVGIDHVRIMLPHDIAITAIESPFDTCGGVWGNEEQVRIRIKNQGYYPANNVSLRFQVDSTGIYSPTQMLSNPIPRGDSIRFTFQAKANLSAIGPHHINAEALFPDDENPKDNSRHQSAGNYPFPIVDIGNDTVVCTGDWVKFKVNTPEAQSFTWNDGSTGSSLLTGKRGQHLVKIIDQNGCPGSDSVYLDLFPQPQVRINFMEPVRCYGDSTGILNVSFYGSVPPYTFEWKDGGSTLHRENLAAAYYPFVLTDQIGCSLNDSIHLVQNDSLYIKLNRITPAGCPVDSGGKVDIQIYGGQAPYHYIWSNGRDTEDLDKILEGSFSVIVTDVYGCVAYSEDYEVPSSDTLPQARFIYNVSGGTVTITDSSTNTVYQTVSFGDGSIPIESEGNASLRYTYSRNGTYQVELIAENSCGTDTFILEIEVDAVSIDNTELGSIIKIGPNPATEDFIYLHLHNPKLDFIELHLYDLNGKECLSQRWNTIYTSGSRRVDLPPLAEGYYLVELDTPLGKLRKKLLIK